MSGRESAAGREQDALIDQGAVQRSDGQRTWSTGLFGCAHDPIGCCQTAVCPCFVAHLIHTKFLNLPTSTASVFGACFCPCICLRKLFTEDFMHITEDSGAIVPRPQLAALAAHRSNGWCCRCERSVFEGLRLLPVLAVPSKTRPKMPIISTAVFEGLELGGACPVWRSYRGGPHTDVCPRERAPPSISPPAQ
jgi:hypothetical protein